MDGNAVTEVERLTLEACEVKTVEGIDYSVKKMIPIYHDPRPNPLNIQSLTGILDYMDANVDSLEIDSIMLHIVDHEKVDLITDVNGESNQRHTVLSATREGRDFPFEQWIEQENFIIKVRSLFMPTDDRASILLHTSKIATDSAIKTGDDGVKQNIQIKKGLSGAITEATEIKPIVKLKPCRTFSEIDQPESDFLFRMKEDHGVVKCALFEADNAEWKNKARNSIKEFLKESGVVIIA